MPRFLNIDVLGCHGGEMAGFLAPSLLISQTILLDAGSFSTVLSHQQQLRIDHVIISHAHCDHVKDLAGFADLIIGYRKKPVKIHASKSAMNVIRNDFFNNRMWPDFFSLPSPQAPVLKPVIFSPKERFNVGPLNVKAIPVNHPVESMGFVFRAPSGGSFVYTGDTGPTELLWKEVNRLKTLKLLMIETKFPNDLQFVADAAGHLTPKTLSNELLKLKAKSVPILVYHLKPDRIKDLEKQISALNDDRIRIMQIGDRFKV